MARNNKGINWELHAIRKTFSSALKQQVKEAKKKYLMLRKVHRKSKKMSMKQMAACVMRIRGIVADDGASSRTKSRINKSGIQRHCTK